MNRHHERTNAPPAGPLSVHRTPFSIHRTPSRAALLTLAWVTAAACAADAPGGPEATHIPVDTVGTVGTLDGADDGLLFGFISQVLPWGDTALVVADGIAGHLYLAGLDGRALAVHDRVGEGPGELQAPAGLSRGADGELVVWDLRLARILRLDLAGGAFRHVGSVRAEATGRSLCTVEGRTFLAAPRQGSVVREVDHEGQVVRAFGEIPEIDGIEDAAMFRELVEGQLGFGPWLCLEGRDGEPGRIILFRDGRPQLAAYSLDGERLWARTLEWMIPTGFEVDVEAGSQRWVVDPERGRHLPISVLPWDDETLLVQLSHQRPVQSEDDPSTSYETSTETLFVAVADGALLGRLDDFPAVRAGGEGRFFAVEMSPVPRVLVLEVATGSGG